MPQMRQKPLIWIIAGSLLLALIIIFVVSISTPSTIDIPKLYFQGDIANMTDKKDVRSIAVSYQDGKHSFEGFAQLKVQGTSSLAYDKKNYTIKLFEDGEHLSPLQVDVGWGNQNTYCLKANWIDKTHARNIVTANLVTQIQRKYKVLEGTPANGAIDGFPIELYINNEFLGLYTFNIPKDAWQFAMDSNNPNHLVVCGEEWDESVNFLKETSWNDYSWSLEVGEETEESLARFNSLIRFVSTSDREIFRAECKEHLDLDALLNYYIVMDFAFLPDNRGKNMLLITYDGDIWYPSLYDLDTSWGSNWKGESLYDYTAFPVPLSDNYLFAMLEQSFCKELSDRYFELRKNILTKKHIMKMFNDFENSIPEETFLKEKEKWGENIPGFDTSQIETFLDVRIPLLDQKYRDMAAQ